ncbi:MAG: aldo/keto reductase [Lachnospiraceae bacterium]|nr:aldo/keto reductase [Lachnospiraceae bacterium]
MKRFKMHNTELEITAIGLGSTTIGSAVGRETSFALMDWWLDYGGNLIDTAHIYGAPTGRFQGFLRRRLLPKKKAFEDLSQTRSPADWRSRTR